MARKTRLIVVSLVLMGGGTIYCLMPPKPGVTLGNFRRVHTGLTEKEVEAILGSPVEKTGFGLDVWILNSPPV
jgi:hypothetical protein